MSDDDLSELLSQLSEQKGGATQSNSTGSSANDDTFYSALDDRSWLPQGRNEATPKNGAIFESDKTVDKTLSPSVAVVDSGNAEKYSSSIEDELRQLERKMQLLRSQLKTKQGTSKPTAECSPTTAPARKGPVPCEIDFTTSTAGQSNSTLNKGKEKSFVHAGDTSSSEDEWNRNRNADFEDGFSAAGPLSAEGRELKKKLKTAAERNGKLKTPIKDASCHWLCIAVVVESSGKRTSANNKPYIIWTLTDLKDCSAGPFKLWLFGDALNKHWKIGTGSVVAIFGAGFMDDNSSDQAVRRLFLLTC